MKSDLNFLYGTPQIRMREPCGKSWGTESSLIFISMEGFSYQYHNRVNSNVFFFKLTIRVETTMLFWMFTKLPNFRECLNFACENKKFILQPQPTKNLINLSFGSGQKSKLYFWVNFILRLTPEQRVPDELAALGELAKESNHHNLPI